MPSELKVHHDDQLPGIIDAVNLLLGYQGLQFKYSDSKSVAGNAVYDLVSVPVTKI